MGQSKTSNAQYGESVQVEPELIDFLYIDDARVDSYISQIKNGTLRSVSTTNATLQGSSRSAGIGLDFKLANAHIGGGEKINNTVSATENYDPYHKKIIDFIDLIKFKEINPLEENTADLGYTGGRISIRNMSIFTKLIPVILKNRRAFGPITGEAKANIEAMGDLLKATPGTIDITITTPNGHKITGIVDEEYLKLPVASILKNFGTALPGEWTVIGICDTVTEPIESDSDYTSVEDMVDTYANMLKNFFTSANIKITPIIILRTIKP